MKIAVFASGGGSNFQALIDSKSSGNLAAEFVLLITNNSNCGAVQKAKDAQIPVLHISGKTHPDQNEFEVFLLESLKNADVELIVLAGYMKKMPNAIMSAYENKILNIHPSLLPAFGGHGFYGLNVHQGVIDYGAKITGATVHLVSGDYDTGAIIAQESLAVLESDTPESLQKRVLEIEHRLYPKVVHAFVSQKVTFNQRKVWI
jgi:phosphoribosylglycinamide formyltransferase-1